MVEENQEVILKDLQGPSWSLNKEIVIMHPGPMNRGVEIDGGVADSDQAIILDQVLNGVASRMSILYLLLRSKEED